MFFVFLYTVTRKNRPKNSQPSPEAMEEPDSDSSSAFVSNVDVQEYVFKIIKIIIFQKMCFTAVVFTVYVFFILPFINLDKI